MCSLAARDQQTQAHTLTPGGSHHPRWAPGPGPRTGRALPPALFLPAISVHPFLTSFRCDAKATSFCVRLSLATHSKTVPSAYSTSSSLIYFTSIPLHVYKHWVYFCLPHRTVSSQRPGLCLCLEEQPARGQCSDGLCRAIGWYMETLGIPNASSRCLFSVWWVQLGPFITSGQHFHSISCPSV